MHNKHEVLIGPYRSGKSRLLLEQALRHCFDAAKAGREGSGLKNETIIIVPSQRYRKLVESRLKELISKEISNQALNKNTEQETKISGLWGLKILTFYQFCQTHLLQAGIFAKLLPDAAKGVLISAVSEQLLQTGKINKLKPILHTKGSQSSILSLIDEWQRAGYTAADIIKKIEIKDDRKESHHYELAEIFSAYQNALKELNYSDQHGLVLQLTDFLNNKREIDWLTNFIVVDGFDRFNYMQINLLKALAKHVQQLYISFDYDSPQENLFEEYAWKVRSYKHIKTLLAESFVFKEMAKQNSAHERPVEIISASDRLAEMAIIAARIKSAMIFDKLKASEIVVTARSLSPYKSAIEAAFKDSGVDYYIDEPIAIASSPITRLLMSLLSLAQEGFKRKQVINSLRSPYFASDKFALTNTSIELVNSLSLKKKVVEGRQQWEQALKAEPLLAKNINAIFEILSMPDSVTSAIDYATWVEDLIEKLLNLNAIDDHLDPLAVWKQKESLSQFRKQLAHLIQEENILQKLKKDQGTISYYQQLSKLVENANFAPAPQSADQVLIASAELVPNKYYRQIYLAGLLEGEFPAPKFSSGFLTTQELEKWRHLNIHIYNPRTESGFEYALFASLVNRAQEKLILSYPSIEIVSSKDELLPSFFFNALNIQSDKELSLSFETKEKSYTSARNVLAYSFWHGQKPGDLIEINKLEIVDNFVGKLQEKLTFAQVRSKQLSRSAVNGYLVDHVAASNAKITLPEYWNASQLNDYGKCPFNFWLSRMLKINPHEEPQIGLSLQDRGIFYHKALELFYQKVIEKKIAMSLDNQKELKLLFDNSVVAAIDWLEKEPWFRPNEFWQQEKNALAFRLNNFFMSELNRFVSEAGQYQPLITEAVFGPENQYQPLILVRDNKEIKIRGKIDRIDIESNSFGSNKKLRLIDYKSGSSSINRDDFESGRNMQLPIYALAAQKSILPGSKTANYKYLSINTGKVLSSKIRDESGVQDDLNILEERIFEFVENIEKGDFSVKPSNDKVCLNCIHKKVCRVKEFPKAAVSEE